MIAKDINENVAIIGGGLAVGHASGSILLKNFADGLHGFGLALALHAQSIPCTIYELRGPPYDHRGALMLSPNALRILYNLVIYERIRGKGFSFENVIVKTATGETTDLYSMGNERLYGYKTLRIYRRILVNELQKIAIERGISIKFE
jgi:2-polyprenyl-6-methoxyphenol hydroxylase-like FAD-dependent oxidoreductase